MNAPVSPLVDWLSVAAQLKGQREALNLGADEIAQRLCLSVKQVKAMDSGNTLLFPGSAAHLWCIKRYAEQVGLDWRVLLADAVDKGKTSAKPNVISSNDQQHYMSTAQETVTLKQNSRQSALEKNDAAISRSTKKTVNTWTRRYVVGASILIVTISLIFFAIKTPIHPRKVEPLPTKAAVLDSVSTKLQEDLISKTTVPPVEIGGVSPEPLEPRSPRLEQTSLASNSEQRNAEVTLPANAPPVVADPKVSLINSSKKEWIDFYGTDRNKQSGSFYIDAKDTVRLMKKNYDAAGDGVAIELARGTEHRISITQNEVIRVVQGDSFTVYYQGQLVPLSILRSGKWVRLIPKQ